MKILVADIGGTKTEFAVVTVRQGREAPLPDYGIESHVRYDNRDFADFESVLHHYLRKHPANVTQAGFALAGPVANQQARLTNLSWHLSAAQLQNTFNLASVTLLNDLEGLAWSVTIVPEDQLITLQTGRKQPGNKAVIAAGTGLGEAIAYCDDNRCHPFATEGGHVDFAAQTPEDFALHQYLQNAQHYVAWEDILSGQGLVKLYRFVLQQAELAEPNWLNDAALLDAAPLISAKALEHRDVQCLKTLGLFVHYYGRAAGNLALKAKATGGVYIGGGITQKILPAFAEHGFIDAFNAKGQMTALLESIPVKIINDRHAALKGVAHYVASQKS